MTALVHTSHIASVFGFRYSAFGFRLLAFCLRLSVFVFRLPASCFVCTTSAFGFRLSAFVAWIPNPVRLSGSCLGRNEKGHSYQYVYREGLSQHMFRYTTNLAFSKQDFLINCTYLWKKIANKNTTTQNRPGLQNTPNPETQHDQYGPPRYPSCNAL